MKLEPVCLEAPPGYPTRAETALAPALLAPQRDGAWMRLLGGGTAAGLCVVLAGCGDGLPATPPPEVRPEAVPAGPTDGAARPEAPPTRAGIYLAPIFEHGKGRGAIGCVVVAPPVFLTEEEAAEVICEELAALGEPVSRAGPGGPQIVVSHTAQRIDGSEGRTRFRAEQVETAIPVDLVGSNGRWQFVFISTKDCDRMDKDDLRSSVQRFDTAGVARQVRQAAGGADARLIAFFYDPVCGLGVRRTEDYNAAQREAKEQSIELLRRQVRDFGTWLAEQRSRG